MGPCYSGYSAIVTIDIKVIADKLLITKAVSTLYQCWTTLFMLVLLMRWLIDWLIARFCVLDDSWSTQRSWKWLGCFRVEY